MAGRASVVFNADTGQYIASVQGMDAATAKAAQAVADAKNKVVSATNAQVSALKGLGASSEELARVQTNASNALATVTEKNSDKIIASLDRVYQKQLAVREASKNLNLDVPQAGHGFSDRMATSAVVRFGEGTTSIRATESFLTMIPGATAAAQGLAVAIGAGGVLGILFELGSKGVEAFNGLRNAMRDATRAADDLHEKSQVLVDDKEIENQKIQDQIAKISGKPNNGLALALLEAKKNADSLALSLQEDRKQMEGLFKDQQRGMLEKTLHAVFNSGPEGTEQQGKELLQGQDDLEGRIAHERANLSGALDNAKDDAARKAATKAYNDAVHRDIQDRIDTLNREHARLTKEEQDSQQDAVDSAAAGTGVASDAKDNSLKKKNIDTNVDMLQTRLRIEQLDTSIYDGQARLGQVKQGKQNDHSAEEAARKAAEAQRQQWQDQLDRAELANPDWNKADTYLLRQDQQKTALPANKLDAEKNLAEAYKAFLRQNAEEVKQINEATQKAQRESWETDYGDWQAAAPRTAQAEADYWSIRMLEADQGSANYLEAERKANEALKRVRDEASRAADARNKAGVQQAGNTARYAEATVALEEQTGGISKSDAATQLATIHTRQYAAEIAALRDELAKQEGFDPDSAATVNARAAVDKEETDRAIQVQRDAANEVGETWKGALNNANAEWVQNATDSAAQVKQLYTQAIDGFNENAADALTGQKTNWAGYARGLGKTVATDGLKRAEAPLLGALGMTKADGSQASPFYVRLADDVAKGFGKLFGHGDADSADSDSGSNSGFGAAIGQGLSGIAKLFSGSGTGGGSDTGTVNDTGAPVGDPTSTEVGSALDQGLGMAVQGFAGGFALGGDVSPGKTITVGEMGPEQLTLGPGSAAHVTPNKDLASGPAPVMYHVSVANGVTPEEFDMRMRSALEAYHPHAVKASVQAVHDAQRRAPASAR